MSAFCRIMAIAFCRIMAIAFCRIVAIAFCRIVAIAVCGLGGECGLVWVMGASPTVVFCVGALELGSPVPSTDSELHKCGSGETARGGEVPG